MGHQSDTNYFLKKWFFRETKLVILKKIKIIDKLFANIGKDNFIRHSKFKSD